jgi:hypothetical protein
MDQPCSICQHAQRSMIDAELAAGLKPSVISARYRIRKSVIEHHTEHIVPHETDSKASSLVDATRDASIQSLSTHRALPQELKDRLARNAVLDQALPDMGVTENPMRQFTRAIDTAVDAYRLADDDPRMQAHMRDYHQEKVKVMLRDDDMGIS